MVFFLSSRRRHTRSKRDWSSDVCSSDLELLEQNKNNLISSYISRLDSQTSALLRAQSAALTGINVTVEEWLDNLQSVTKDDVMKVAKMVELQATYMRSEEHTSELQSRFDLVCRLLLEKKK